MNPIRLLCWTPGGPVERPIRPLYRAKVWAMHTYKGPLWMSATFSVTHVPTGLSLLAGAPFGMARECYFRLVSAAPNFGSRLTKVRALDAQLLDRKAVALDGLTVNTSSRRAVSTIGSEFKTRLAAFHNQGGRAAANG